MYVYVYLFPRRCCYFLLYYKRVLPQYRLFFDVQRYSTSFLGVSIRAREYRTVYWTNQVRESTLKLISITLDQMSQGFPEFLEILDLINFLSCAAAAIFLSQGFNLLRKSRVVIAIAHYALWKTIQFLFSFSSLRHSTCFA